MKSITLALAIALCGCSTAQTTKFTDDFSKLGQIVVTCGNQNCGASNPTPICQALETAIVNCLMGTALGNPAACIAAAPPAIALGYADVTCVLADLATANKAASPTVQTAPLASKTLATAILKSQNVTVTTKGGP